MAEIITRRAYAKINLCLDVLGKRPDGYHDLKMIMQNIGVYDELTFRTDGKHNENPQIRLIIENLPAGVDLGPVESNLIYRTAKLILDEYNTKTDVIITLKKNIPAAAGLAGGSTDAAAVFHGLNELLRLNMTVKDMQALGVKLGADIPYCIMGGTALSEGIGDILTPLPTPPACHILLVKPSIDVSTKFVYESLVLDENTSHPDVDGMITAIKEQRLDEMAALLKNVLEAVTVKKYPVINEIKKTMTDHGALGALMSGSGPTVFGLFENKAQAENTAELFRTDEAFKSNISDIFVTAFVS